MVKYCLIKFENLKKHAQILPTIFRSVNQLRIGKIKSVKSREIQRGGQNRQNMLFWEITCDIFSSTVVGQRSALLQRKIFSPSENQNYLNDDKLLWAVIFPQHDTIFKQMGLHSNFVTILSTIARKQRFWRGHAIQKYPLLRQNSHGMKKLDVASQK